MRDSPTPKLLTSLADMLDRVEIRERQSEKTSEMCVCEKLCGAAAAVLELLLRAGIYPWLYGSGLGSVSRFVSVSATEALISISS